MTPKEQPERWEQLKRLRWSIILLFFVLLMFNTYPSIKQIPFMSGAAVAHAYFGSLVQLLLIPTFIVIGTKERRARLAVRASNISLAEESASASATCRGCHPAPVLARWS
jgi:hypothetical protein